MNIIAPVAIVEREIVFRAVSASLGAISDSITSIRDTSTCEVGKEITDHIARLDIQCELAVAKAFIQDLEEKNYSSRAVCAALDNLHQVTTELGDTVQSLEKSVVEYYEMTRIGKWWYGSASMTSTMSHVETLFAKMRGRFTLLLRLVMSS